MTCDRVRCRSACVDESFIPLITRHFPKMQSLRIYVVKKYVTALPTVAVLRLQRAFALRPAFNCFSQLSDLAIHGHFKGNNRIESSAFPFLLERLKHNLIKTLFFRQLQAVLSPVDCATLARYDQGIYEEPELRRSSRNKRKAKE